MRSTIRRALLQFGATALTTAVLFHYLPANHLFYVWPLTGVQLAILWSVWNHRLSRVTQICAATAGFLAILIFQGYPLRVVAGLTCIQGLELWGMAAVLRLRISRFDDLKQMRHVARFGIVAVVVPMIAATLRAAVFYNTVHRTFLQTWFITGMAHSVGLMVTLPGLLFLISEESRRSQKFRSSYRLGLPAMLLTFAVTFGVFAQSKYPWLFLVFPPIVLALLVWGLEGAAIICPVITLMACYATAHHHGPVWVVVQGSMEIRTVVLQVFLWMVPGTALPVGALLDERQKAESEARAGQMIYQTLLDNAEDMILLSGLDGGQRYVSPGVLSLTGWQPEEFLSLAQLETLHVEDRDLARNLIESLRSGKRQHHFRYRILCKDASYKWVEAFLRGYSSAEDGHVTGYVATVRDMGSLARLEEQWSQERADLTRQNMHLEELAGNDELTRLANRRTFNRMLTQEVARHARAKNSLSMLMVDVDFFKKYNDRYGHPEGDVCLRMVAESIQIASRASDFAARVGGEEFTVLLPDTDQAGAEQAAQRILSHIESLQIRHEGSPFGYVTVSIGAATWPPEFVADEAYLIQQADRALYESKKTGRNRLTSMTADLQEIADGAMSRRTES
ncbi:sensor domain-containing diguanylate cyclase [Granulicella tundricola]|uniref:diguanylate cyclase n=1 Tax=Granulicella tundricola (strain ATCC BAA-1859 / DSM 23138 / MP5ACTX9) TaxID=1198114 RepID=E8X0M4_GRATM|nr:diguanylate cyclase [Granulicella tundricola]ADW68975.1 diguanylate cyclase with PAS/PAC sensor [Granulicella tundricola MP5ACTX9]